MGKQYRQGDVLIEGVAKIPNWITESVAERDEEKRLVIALGEATGHAHAIKDENATLFRAGDASYIRVMERPASLVHEEHDTIELPVGEYQVTMQRQQDPRSDRQTERRANYD